MKKGQRVWIRFGYYVVEARIMDTYDDGKYIKYQIPFGSGRLSWYQIVFPIFSFTKVEDIGSFKERIT